MAIEFLVNFYHIHLRWPQQEGAANDQRKGPIGSLEEKIKFCDDLAALTDSIGPKVGYGKAEESEGRGGGHFE